MKDIMKETNDLRDTIRFFEKTEKRGSEYLTVFAERPDFIKIGSYKLIPQFWTEGVYFCKSGNCNTTIIKRTKGFIVVGYNQEKNKFLTVFQCNDCKDIQLSYNKVIDERMRD